MLGQRRRSRPTAISRVLRPTSVVALVALISGACGGATPSASASAASAPAASEPAASTPASPAAQTSRSSARSRPRSRSRGTGSSTPRSRPRRQRVASTTTFQDDIGYSGDMERVLREVAGTRPARHHLRRRVRQRGGRPPRRRGVSRHRLRVRVGRRPRRARTSRSSTTGSTSRPTWPGCWPAA